MALLPLPLLTLSIAFAAGAWAASPASPASPLDDVRGACSKPGGVPDPRDPLTLLLCAEEELPVARVRCPQGMRASAALQTCEEIRDTREASPSPSPSPWGCQGPGMRCADCEVLQLCSVVGGQAVAVANVSCSDVGLGFACNPEKRMCTAGSCSVPRADAFRCLGDEALPDPEDCKRYHLCRRSSATQHFTGVCDVVYDADAGSCAPADGDPPCAPLPPCSPTQPTASRLPSRPAFYRVCVPLGAGRYSTIVQRCPDGQVFDQDRSACGFECVAGTKGRFADPEDCHAYFVCSGKDGPAQRSVCVPGTAYDAARGTCQPEASVRACSPTPTTTSSATPTPSPTPTPTPTPTPATQTPAPPVPECQRIGNIPDPQDCHRYYECLRPFFFPRFIRNLRVCPSMMYFNTMWGQCSVGSC